VSEDEEKVVVTDMNPEHLADKILGSVLELDAQRQEVGEPSSITIDMLLERRNLRTELRAWAPNASPETLIVLLAISAASDVLSVWRSTYPGLLGPMRAIAAAEEWVTSPTPDAARAASSAAEQASTEAQSVWHENKVAGWAGRTASWAGMAPSYPWAAVAALVGAVRTAKQDAVSRALSNSLKKLARLG
jgi:hypothetical protein